MSKVGDVVFCVDCDLARSAHSKVAIGDSSGSHKELPRRMAIKKDASGDALCRACLDARVQRRRADFLQTTLARNADPEPQAAMSSVGDPTAPVLRGAAPTKPLATTVRSFSSVRIERVRIERVRPTVKSTARKPLDKKRVVSETLAEVHRASERAARAKALKAWTSSLQLAAAEIGLSRAHELLAQIRAAALAGVGRSR